MANEQHANRAVSTIGAPLTNSATTLTIASVTAFLIAGNFHSGVTEY